MIGKRVLGLLGFLSAVAGLSLAASVPTPAQAQPVIGVPHDWQMGFPPSYTPLMDRVESLHDLLLVIITLISLFVAGLLGYVIWRFHASRNPTPSVVTHNTVLEIAWTILPILILVVIAIPSFRLLYYGDKAQDAAMTIKVTGHQWYWQYEYPDQGNISFNSNLVDVSKRKPDQPRLVRLALGIVDEVAVEADIALVGIFVLPVPLMPGDLDRHRRVGNPVHVVHQLEGRDSDEDEDQDRHDRPQNLDHR